MKHIAIISLLAVAIFSGYCYSSNVKKTTTVATVTAQEGVCVGGDMEGLVCMK